jgi:predicted ArsR family transcriptional regulator
MLHLTNHEKATLHALSEFNEPVTVGDVAWKVREVSRYGITTNNRSKTNRGLNSLVDKGYATREVGLREPMADGRGRPPFRYSITELGFARLSEFKA